MFEQKKFNDAADRSTASYRQDMAAEIDSLEDVLTEMIAGLPNRLAEETRRVVVAIAAGALRKSENQERLMQMFGTSAPGRSDLEVFALELAAVIDGDANPQLQAKCVDFVFSFGLNGGKSQTEIGEEQGVGKATVSKRCRGLLRMFDRDPSRARGMKTEKAVQSYRERQKGKRARPEREKWQFSGFLTQLFPNDAANA